MAIVRVSVVQAAPVAFELFRLLVDTRPKPATDLNR